MFRNTQGLLLKTLIMCVCVLKIFYDVIRASLRVEVELPEAPFVFAFVFGGVTMLRNSISFVASIAFMAPANSLLVSSPLIGLWLMLTRVLESVLWLLFSLLLLSQMLSSLKDVVAVDEVVIAAESDEDVFMEDERSEVYATSIPEYLIPFNSRLTANSCSPFEFVP